MGAEREVADAQVRVVDLPPTAVVQEVKQAHSHLPVELAPEQVTSDIRIVTEVTFVLNIMLQIFFDGFLKKRINVCRDKIQQNNA